MEVEESIRGRASVRAYAKQKPQRGDVKRLIEAAVEAPSACNLQLTEYIIVDDEAILARLAKTVSGKFEWAPCYIVLIYDPRFTVKRHAALVSLGAAAENIMLRAVELGLATCPMAGFDRDDLIKRELDIPPIYEIGLVIALGYAEPPARARERVPAGAVHHVNRYEKKNHLMRAEPQLGAWSISEAIAYRSRIAPVYLYPGRHNLHSFKQSAYSGALRALTECCTRHHGPSLDTARVLDLVTYDGEFARAYLERFPCAGFVASDYFDYPLRVLGAELPQTRAAVYTNECALQESDRSFDVVTFVHKTWFSPQRDKLVREATRVLRDGGVFFVTLPTASRKHMKDILRGWFRPKRGTSNVYEGNRYYKIGPWEPVTAREMKALAESAGLALAEEGFYEGGTWQWYEKR